jgi:hypothetical protein
MLLIRSNPATWAHPMFLYQHETLSDEERDERMAAFTALLDEITESGELVDSAPLADPATSRTVRVRDSVVLTTDGPFLEAKEHLAGYFVVDCVSIGRAIELASRFPDARYGAVEVRPVMDMSGLEM